uniref:Potassium channel domain-containing protein n=1 Tax=Parascaris equorum TaxID=6256 RepID=A0A914R948_PAREQ
MAYDVRFSEIRWRACENSKLPLSTILTLFIITFAFGSLLFYHKGKGFSIDDIYFSIISFATVGFGDKFPTADDPIRLIGMMCYLVWGMILMTTMFSVVSAYLRMVLDCFLFLESLMEFTSLTHS